MTGASRQRLEVVAVVLVQDGKVLLARRNRGALHGLWEFPGGKRDVGETMEQTAAREIREELDMVIEPIQALLALDHDYPDKRIRLHFYQCRCLPGQFPRIGSDQSHLEFAWFAPADLPLAECCPADRRAAETLPWSDIMTA